VVLGRANLNWLCADGKTDAEARALEIMRLAAKGWSNHQIAEKTGLHPGSVSRIISKRLRTSP